MSDEELLKVKLGCVLVPYNLIEIHSIFETNLLLTFKKNQYSDLNVRAAEFSETFVYLSQTTVFTSKEMARFTLKALKTASLVIIGV